MSASDRTDRRSRKGDEQLLVGLASGLSIREASEKAGLSDRTARRRLAEPGFAERLSDLRMSWVRDAMGHLCSIAGKAARTLEALLDGKSEATRLSAARAIVEMAVRVLDYDDLSRRINELETEAGIETESVVPRLITFSPGEAEGEAKTA